MSLRTWSQRWWPRHRWLISYPPGVDDAQSFVSDYPTNDPTQDARYYEWSAQQSNEKRVRRGGEEYREDEIDT